MRTFGIVVVLALGVFIAGPVQPVFAGSLDDPLVEMDARVTGFLVPDGKDTVDETIDGGDGGTIQVVALPLKAGKRTVYFTVIRIRKPKAQTSMIRVYRYSDAGRFVFVEAHKHTKNSGRFRTHAGMIVKNKTVLVEEHWRDSSGLQWMNCQRYDRQDGASFVKSWTSRPYAGGRARMEKGKLHISYPIGENKKAKPAVDTFGVRSVRTYSFGSTHPRFVLEQLVSALKSGRRVDARGFVDDHLSLKALEPLTKQTMSYGDFDTTFVGQNRLWLEYMPETAIYQAPILLAMVHKDGAWKVRSVHQD